MVGRTIDTVGLLLLAIVLCSSCSDVFDVHPYAVDFDGETDINARHSARITRDCLGNDTLRVVVMSDTQGWYDEMEDMVDHINAQGKADFVIHGGDLTNYGSTKEYVMQRGILDRLDMPYVVILGNHDCLGTGEETYKKMFGPTNFSFIAARVKFVCLNTNALEGNDDDAIPDMAFLEGELVRDGSLYDRTVVCMHAPPLCEQFNNDRLQEFHQYLHRFPGLLFCTAGHLHRNDIFSPLDDGISYFVSESANRRSYLLFTITPEGYSHEVIRY